MSLYIPLNAIDWATELQLRSKVIEAGFWPDNRLYLNDPEGFKAAKQSIIDSGKKLIETFGTGAAVDRGKLDVNRFVIRRMSIEPGQVGFVYPYYYEKDDDFENTKTYSKKRISDTLYDMNYEIRLIAGDVAYDRIMSMFMVQAFGRRTFLYGVNENGDAIPQSFTVQNNYTPVDLSDEDYIERLYRYVVRDVLISPEEVQNANIAAIEEFNTSANFVGEDEDNDFKI